MILLKKKHSKMVSALLIQSLLLTALVSLIPSSLAVKFELPASHGAGTRRCIQQFIDKGDYLTRARLAWIDLEGDHTNREAL
jgi:hypothetical protein